MLRQKLDEYLDGALDPPTRREVEATLAADPAAAALLARLKSQRALREAAFDTYFPTPHESKALADRVLARAYDSPIGHVGTWVRRGAAVAAAVAVVVGTFFLGRMTVTPKVVTVPEPPHTVYNVVWIDSFGVQSVQDFASVDERNTFIQRLEREGATGIAYNEVFMPGHM
jgi:anti-sigma factor RsiW